MKDNFFALSITVLVDVGGLYSRATFTDWNVLYIPMNKSNPQRKKNPSPHTCTSMMPSSTGDPITQKHLVLTQAMT